MKSHQVASIGGSSIVEQVVRKVAASSACSDPFRESAGWEVTVVVDGGGPARHNVQSGKAIASDGRNQWPVLIYLHQVNTRNIYCQNTCIPY